MSDELKSVTEYEKQEILAQIKQHVYERRPAGMRFRIGYGLHDYFMRLVICMIILGFAYWAKSGTPRGREDRDWLI